MTKSIREEIESVIKGHFVRREVDAVGTLVTVYLDDNLIDSFEKLFRSWALQTIEEIGRKSEGDFPVGFWGEVRGAFKK